MWPETANVGGWRSPQAFAGTRHEYAGAGASGQVKTPTENGWGFLIVVEAAGIEPASTSHSPDGLHA